MSMITKESASIIINQAYNLPQQFITTLVASIVGFVFGVLSFYLTEAIRNKNRTRQMKESLIKELQYDADRINSFKAALEKMNELVINNNYYEPFEFIYFTKIQSLVAFQALNEGLLYKLLESYDLSQLNGILSKYSIQNQEFINKELLAGYELRKDQTKKDVVLQAILRYKNMFMYDHEELVKIIDKLIKGK